MAKKGQGLHYNASANYPYEVSPYETVAQTAKRLERSSGMGWAGSISIHGNLLKAGTKRRDASDATSEKLVEVLSIAASTAATDAFDGKLDAKVLDGLELAA